MENLWVTFFAIFAAETVKNLAKGAATPLQQKLHLILADEFVALNLQLEDAPENVEERLVELPELVQRVQHKLDSHPDLLREFNLLQEKRFGRNIQTKTYIENAGDIKISQ